VCSPAAGCIPGENAIRSAPIKPSAADAIKSSVRWVGSWMDMTAMTGGMSKLDHAAKAITLR
jgi:hypothetical protein